MEKDSRKYISHKFKFGLTKLFSEQTDIAYCETNLYVKKGKSEEIVFPLNCIASLRRTWNEYVGLKEWEIELRIDGKYRCISFYPTRSFWRNNFDDFFDFMKSNFPDVVKSKNNWF